MNTDDEFCIQMISQSVIFKESTSLSFSFRLCQGHHRVQGSCSLGGGEGVLGLSTCSSTCPTPLPPEELTIVLTLLSQGLLLFPGCPRSPSPMLWQLDVPAYPTAPPRAAGQLPAGGIPAFQCGAIQQQAR